MNGIDFNDFRVRNILIFMIFVNGIDAFSENWFKVGCIYSENWLPKVGYIFLKNRIRSGVYSRRIGIKSGIHFGKIGIWNGYVFEASMARPRPKSGQVPCGGERAERGRLILTLFKLTRKLSLLDR